MQEMYPNQNNNNQNPYQYNEQINPQKNEGSIALAVVGLILSILALIGGICYCVAIPFGIAGIIISIIVLAKKKKGKGMGIAGVIMSALAILISVGTIIAFKPMAEDFTKFSENLPEIVEDYQKDGSVPDYLEKYKEEYPEYFDAFMEGVIEEYEKNPSAYSQQ